MTFTSASRPKLGQAVLYSAQLERTYDPKTQLFSWVAVAIPQTYGFYAGHRVKHTGKIVPGDWETPTEWERAGSIPCALIIYNEFRKPIYVPFDTLELL
jgi:hypothetical protein